jgi:hypothetical protein
MFHSLIHRQQREVSGVGQAALTVKRLQIAQYPWTAVLDRDHAIHEVRTRQMQRFLRNPGATMFQQMVGFITE